MKYCRCLISYQGSSQLPKSEIGRIYRDDIHPDFSIYNWPDHIIGSTFKY